MSSTKELFKKFDLMSSYFDLIGGLKDDDLEIEAVRFYEVGEVKSFDMAVKMIEWLINGMPTILSTKEFDYKDLTKCVLQKVEKYLSTQGNEKQYLTVLGKVITQEKLNNIINLLNAGADPNIKNVDDFVNFIQK